jgi:hypothetical protein
MGQRTPWRQTGVGPLPEVLSLLVQTPNVGASAGARDPWEARDRFDGDRDQPVTSVSLALPPRLAAVVFRRCLCAWLGSAVLIWHLPEVLPHLSSAFRTDPGMFQPLRYPPSHLIAPPSGLIACTNHDQSRTHVGNRPPRLLHIEATKNVTGAIGMPKSRFISTWHDRPAT